LASFVGFGRLGGGQETVDGEELFGARMGRQKTADEEPGAALGGEIADAAFERCNKMAPVTLTLRLSTKPRIGTLTRRVHAASSSAAMPSRSLPSTRQIFGNRTESLKSWGKSSPSGCVATSS
jgi:hypothetical protein